MVQPGWKIHRPDGALRVIVTKDLPGARWVEILAAAGCRVEVCTSAAVLSRAEIRAAFGGRCDGAIGQLTEEWGEELFSAFKAAGGRAYSNYAVGFNNVDLAAATRHGIPVGNTPGVLTETTAEMAVALTFAAARRVGESERFLRAGRYTSWLPTLFLGELLRGKTVGIIGAGRIGEAYARMMMEGHKMDLVYYDLRANDALERYAADYGRFLQAHGQRPVTCRRAPQVDDLLRAADVVSIHTVLDVSTRHLINAERLARMKPNAVIVNTSRGPVIDEAALVAHCRAHPEFRAGLDVFENEPRLAPGLAELDNVVIVPHIASATRWTREGMAILAAANVAGLLTGAPAWNRTDVMPFLGAAPPPAAPSVLNAKELGMPLYG
ncbi:MAG: D-glycerate dehydrogenase [Desulfobacterales bacterium]|jgi:hydroxypyruvate reductase 1|nr:D-glycerate dehydrogenase [Desulfobacterales bacterium]